MVNFPDTKPSRERGRWLLDSGVRFPDMAGNDVILVSVVAPASLDEDVLSSGRVVASRPIPTDAQRKRFAVSVAVSHLREAGPTLRSAGATIVYDS